MLATGAKITTLGKARACIRVAGTEANLEVTVLPTHAGIILGQDAIRTMGISYHPLQDRFEVEGRSLATTTYPRRAPPDERIPALHALGGRPRGGAWSRPPDRKCATPERLLDAGIIQRAHTPWASPVLLVPKPGGEKRLVVDSREPPGHSNYYWHNMAQDVSKHVKACAACARARNIFPKRPYLQSIKVSRMFQLIEVDTIGPLPETERGNSYIFVAVDHLTKWAEVEAVPSKTAANSASQLLKTLDIRHATTTPYHPSTNGLVERTNRTLITILKKLVDAKKSHWDIYLALALRG